MQTIHVTASRQYDCLLEAGLLARAGELIREDLIRRRGGSAAAKCRRICIVSDEIVSGLYGQPEQEVYRSLEQAGFEVSRFVFPGGEDHKNLRTIESLLDHLTENSFTRSDMLVALGGGITGDVTGFAAAIYQRGIEFVQIPTSLLAAVDSSVGGKTGVNLRAGKNLTGAFWQPNLVIFDPQVLATLSEALILDGMAEILKAGLIKDPGLTKDACELKDDPPRLLPVISRAIDIKRQIVEADERESGERKLLNLGHTLAHAIETCSGYAISHGAAVAMGTVIIAKASEQLGWSEAGCAGQIREIFERFGYRLDCPFSAGQLAAVARGDKKAGGSCITLVIPETPGRCILKDVPLDELEEVIRKGL